MPVQVSVAVCQETGAHTTPPSRRSQIEGVYKLGDKLGKGGGAVGGGGGCLIGRNTESANVLTQQRGIFLFLEHTHETALLWACFGRETQHLASLIS